MAKYILVYKSNEASDWTKLPEPEVKKVMQAWGEWIGSMGANRKDSSAFRFGGKVATKSGPQDADNLSSGYAIIEAKDIDEALSIAQKAPSVQDDSGTIEVYEAFAVMD